MRVIALATAAAVTLVVVYLAFGGASYSPAKVADPCVPRAWRNPHGIGEVAEQVVLSAIDGAACKLGVSREAIVLAFANRASLQRFSRQHCAPSTMPSGQVRSARASPISCVGSCGASRSAGSSICFSSCRASNGA